MKFKSISEKIIDLKNADLELRDKLVQSGQISEGYSDEMKDIHNRNARTINDIVELSPNLLDDLTKVNERRKFIGLNTLEEQTEIIRRHALNENQSPPQTLKKGKRKWKNGKKMSVGQNKN